MWSYCRQAGRYYFVSDGLPVMRPSIQPARQIDELLADCRRYGSYYFVTFRVAVIQPSG